MGGSRAVRKRTTWLVGEELQEVPLRPTPPRSPRSWSAAAAQLTGLSGPFHYDLFQKRNLLFHRQHVYFDGNFISELGCDFYERLGSPEEVITAMKISAILSKRGVNSIPRQALVVEIFPSMYDAPNGIVPMPEADEHSIGDHVVLLLDLEDEYLFFLNNWGPRWGNNGTGRFTVEYLRHFQREAWSIRPLAGPQPETMISDKDAPAFGSEQFRRLIEHAWDGSEGSSFFLLHHGDRLDFLGRWLIGIGNGSTWLQCVAILREMQGDPIVVGWIHIRGNPGSVAVEELFVWPPYRERGIGTALAGQALLYTATAAWPQCRWTWQEPEADAMVRQRSQIRPQLPHWLMALIFQGDSARPEDVHQSFFELLKDLAELQAPDGVRLIQERAGSRMVDVIVNDIYHPAYGVVIST
jgi:GNAT superfamily N-acetyltransferase